MNMLTDSGLLRARAYINGTWQDAVSGKAFAVLNPANGTVLGHVPDMGRQETDDAISAAEQAFRPWAARTAAERAALLHHWHQLILQHADDLARLMTAECGKPIAEARGEVGYGASFIPWFAEEGRRARGEIIPTNAPSRRILVQKQPVGVVAAITPWNFPLAMITRKVAPALAAGCTVVVKPAEATPLTALALAELADRAGFPAGVFNVVTAAHGREVGAALTDSPIVRKLSFTGSTAVGKHLIAASARTVKKVSMELGGNAPFIVFNDADLDAAVQGAIAAKFRNNGQTCVCTNRFLVQSGIHDQFSARLTEALADLKVGDGSDPATSLGPLINRAGLQKVSDHVADAVAQGASIALGGEVHDRGGNFFQPTVLTNMRPDMRIAREETFGPVAALFPFDTESEAVQMANDTEFGLAAYFYTRDLARIWRVAEALEYGMVGINEGMISTEVAPFGGVKQSGIGREGAKQGIDEYMDVKYLCFGGN